MTFNRYYRQLSPEGKKRLATRVNTSVAYLSHLAHGHRSPGGELVLRILIEARGEIPATLEAFGFD